ncbi:right-handed parallel beta-helix repeat-containing protein, partial [Candidatus Micrarchaeota archaeon]|nr:right-handed parallel beta-helix repeat-containing protein [Candidatus Micrarchaeota archaeon]
MEKKGVLFGLMFGLLVILGIFIGLSGCVEYNEQGTGLGNPNIEKGLFALSDDGLTASVKIFDNNVSGMSKYSYLMPENTQLLITTSEPMTVRAAKSEYGDSYVSFHGNLDAVNVDALSSYIENKFVDVNAPYARKNVKTAMTLKNNKNKEQDITTKFDFDYPNDIIIINDKEINMDKGDVIRFKLFDNKIIIAKGNGDSGNMIHTNSRIDKIFIPKGANYYSLDMSDLDVDGLNSNMIITPSKKIDGGVHFELIVNSHIKPGQEVSFDPSFGIAEPTSNYIKAYKFNQTWVKSRIVSYDINNDGEKELILLKDDKINIINNNGKIINVLYEPNVIGFGRTFDAGKINDDTYIVVGAVNSILFYKYNNRTNDFDKPIILNTNGFTFIDYVKIVSKSIDLFEDKNDYLIFGSYTGIDKYTGIISIVKLDKQISNTDLNGINFYTKTRGNLVFAPNDIIIMDMNGDGNKDMIISYPYIDTVYIVPVNNMGGDLDQIYMNKFNGDDELFGASMVIGKDMKDKIFIGAPGKDNESGYIYLMTRIKGTNEYNKTRLIKGTKGFGSSITFANGLNRLYIGSPDESAVYSFDFKADDENKLELNKAYTTSDKKSRFGDELGMVYDSPSKGELMVIAPNESLGGVLYSITETTTTHCVNLSDSSTWDPDGDGIDNIELGDEHFIIYQNTTLCQGTYDLSYLPDEPGGAIYFWGSNIFLDCNNSVLIAGGPDMPYSRSGIRIDNKNKITIKNCVISGFIRGIEIKNATSCNFINNTIEYTKQGFLSYGLYFSNLTNNTVRYNFRDGLYLTSLTSEGVTYAIQNNKIINNKIYENGRDGILLQGGHDLANNTIVSNAIYNNSAHGISIYQIDNNNISGNEVCNNGIDDINLFGTSSNFGDNICDNLTNPIPSPVTCSQPCGCNDCGNLVNVHITPEMPNTDNINNDDNLTCTVHIATQNNGCTSGTVTFNWTATPYASSSTPNTPPGCTNQITTVPFTITGSGDVSDYYSLNISRHPCTSGAGLLYNIINCSATVNYTNGQCTPESDWDAVCVVPTLHSGEGNLNVHICNCSSPQTSPHPPCVCDYDPNILPLNSPSTLYCTFNTTVFQRMLSQWIIGGGPGGGSVNISFYDQSGNILQTNSCPTTYNFNNYFGPSGCAVYQCNSPACYLPNNVSCSVGITSSFSSTSGMVCPLTGLTAGGSSEDITIRPPIGWLQTAIYADGLIEPDMGGSPSPHATRNSTFVCLGSGSYSAGDPINLSKYRVTFYTYDSSGNYRTLASRRCDGTNSPPAYYYVNDPNSQDENACNVYLGCSGNGLCIKGRDVYCNMTPIPSYNLDPPLSNSSGPIRVHNTPPKIGPPITVLTGNTYSCKLNSSSYSDIDNDNTCPGGCDPVSNVTYYWQWLGNSSWHGSDSEIQNPNNIYWLNITPCSDMYTQPGYAHIFPDSFEIHKITQEEAHWCREGVIPSGTLYTNVSSLFEDAFCTNLSSIHGSSGATNYIDWYDVSAGNYPPNCDDNYRGSSTNPSQSFTLDKNDLFFKDMNGFYFGRFIYHPISVRCCIRVEDTVSSNGDEQNWSNIICSSPEICNDMGACGNCTIQYDHSGEAINITCTQNSSCITNESAGIQCYTYNYNTCTGNSNPTNPLDEFINSSNPDYRAVSRCTGCYNVTRCVKKIDDTTGEIEYYHHIFDKCSNNVYEYKLNLSDPDNLTWAKEHCEIVNCESKYGSAYGPKNSTTGDWRYYDIPDVETVNVVSPIPDPNGNMAGQYSEFECTPNANEIITEPQDSIIHVCLPEDDPLCSEANYTEITNYTIHYHKRLYRWKYSNIWDPLFWTECENDGDDRCDNSDSLFPGYVKNGYITGWTEGLKRINCSTYDICKKHEQVSCDYQEIINYTKNVTRIGRWDCSMIDRTPICSGSSDGSTPFSIETIINTSENGSDDDAICGLSRGIIINNTAPIINSIDILNQSGGTYLAPIPMIPSSSSPGSYTDYIYAKCIPDFNDTDTHVPDHADTILYAFNYTNGAGINIQLQDYTDRGNGGDLLNLSEMIGHISSLNAGDKITCCVKMNDTHWQSKWSNTSCKTVPVGNQAPVCDHVNLTGDCKIGQFTCEAVGCTDPDGHSLGNYYYTIMNSSGYVLMTNVSSSNTWTFNGQDWMNKCEPIYCGVVVEDNPLYPLTPVNSTEYYNSTNVSNCAPQVSPTMQIASGDLTTGIVYLDSRYSDPDDDPPEQFYWTITYTDSSCVSHNIYPGSDYDDIIINYTNPVDTDGRNWSWSSSSIQFYSLNYVPGLSGHDLSDIRNVSPFINMSALPGGGITSTGEKLTVCVKAQDYDNGHANCHNTTDYICRDITYLS